MCSNFRDQFSVKKKDLHKQKQHFVWKQTDKQTSKVAGFDINIIEHLRASSSTKHKLNIEAKEIN